MQITDIKIRKTFDDDGPMKAIASVTNSELNHLSNRTFLSRMAEQIRVKYELFLPELETRSYHE